jgi:branched-chain amino acid transport system substrate-binding protein
VEVKWFFLIAVAVLVTLAGCQNPSSHTGGNGGGEGKPSGAGENGGGRTTSSGEEIVIGEYGSFSGENAAFGNSTHNGIELAIDEINKAGGVLGKQVRIVKEDDQSKTEQVTTVVKKLINQEKVVAVLGEVASSRSIAGSSVCEEAKVPMVSPSSTNPAVTVDKRTGKVKPYTFRICFIDPFQGTIMARFAKNNLKLSRVAILRDIKQDYSVGLAEYFVKEFEKLGGTIVSNQSYTGGVTDFRAELTSIKNANPQAIFIPAYYNDAGNIAKQAKSLGITAPLLGGDGWDHPDVVKLGGKAVEGVYLSTHMSAEDKNPIVQKFVRTYQARYRETPSGLAACGYDAAKILCDAIQRAGSTDREAIRKALEETKDFEGVTGKITINKEHNAVKPLVVVQIRGGQLRYVSTIKP